MVENLVAEGKGRSLKILNKLPKVAGKIKDDRKIIIKLRINLFSTVFVIFFNAISSD